MQVLEACAWCGRVKLEEWVEEEEALRRLRSYEWDDPPSFSSSICEGCAERLVRRRETAEAEARAA